MNGKHQFNDEPYFTMAIQSVLHQHRKEIGMLMDQDHSIPLIKKLSKEILSAAQNFKAITENAVLSTKKGMEHL
ncbi:hypothetical protein [Ferviditalea candida]|uniref:Uncharacterized protein n=1 Tax=Ferviditalea candida TaxID=3108399 RepID=A0ABU5ZI71_9BACL|nr:hypothetical protein [Paenibacillaceae bacterium T2]